MDDERIVREDKDGNRTYIPIALAPELSSKTDLGVRLGLFLVGLGVMLLFLWSIVQYMLNCATLGYAMFLAKLVPGSPFIVSCTRAFPLLLKAIFQ